MQAEEFDYLFHTVTAKLPFDETSQMTIRSKVRFYTGFHAYDVLQTIEWLGARQ